jgi:hypothetical protein
MVGFGNTVFDYDQEFDKVNPVPADCKDPATFEQVRAHALKLFCENAFWSEVKMDEPVRQKLIEAGMWSESWNALQFVHKCVQRANSWIKSAEEPMAEDQPKTSNDGFGFAISSNSLTFFQGKRGRGSGNASCRDGEEDCGQIFH